MYRIVEDSFWDDPQIAALSKDEKIVAVCLFTNVHTKPCGVYRIGVDRIAAMTKVQVTIVQKVFRRLAETDIAYYDGTEVCIPGYIRRQRYKGPLIAKRVATELAQVKNRSFVEKVVERYPDFLKLGGYRAPKPENTGAKADGRQFTHEAAIEELHEKELKGRRAPRFPLEIAKLTDEIETKLKFTGGIRKTSLEELVRREPEGIAGVRAALARAIRYYETARAEKWKSFVIARRFSKFREFYGEAFSSDEAAAIYIERIRAANERETRKLRREASLQVGAERPEPENVLSPEEIQRVEIADLKYRIGNAEAFLKNKNGTPKEREQVEKNIERLKNELKEATKENWK